MYSEVPYIKVYEKVLAKGRMKYSVDLSRPKPKMSRISRKISQTGINNSLWIDCELWTQFHLGSEQFQWTPAIPSDYCKTSLVLLFWQCPSPRGFRKWRGLWKLFTELNYVIVNLQQKLFPMTAHYIGWNKKPVGLACFKLSGNHTYVLTKIIENKLKKYLIHKCKGVVTDDTSNFVKTFKESATTEVSEKMLWR